MKAAVTHSATLAYHPPIDWTGLLSFLGTRSLKGVEHASDGVYRRTVRVGGHSGWVTVQHDANEHLLRVDLSQTLGPVTGEVLQRLRHMFDVDAEPDVIADALRRVPLLADAVARNPGLRVPGAYDGFELAVRAILGQQITVKAAATLAGRFSTAFGAPVTTPFTELSHLSPAAERVASASIDDIASLGIIRARTISILRLAEETAAGRLKLEAGGDIEAVMKQLMALPGIGPWTAHYIAMRALRAPDAFPKEDIALRSRLGGVSSKEADAMSQPWRPWRSYATLHLWSMPDVKP